jgi:hypothetical protein
MPRFKGSFSTIKLDVPGYTAALDARMQEVLEEGARQWVAAATGRVPLWTGMARASLRPITKLVNGSIVLSPLRDKSRIPEGERLGDASLTARFPEYKLSISTSVTHFVIQDDNRVSRGGSPSAPWKAFDAGNAALQAVLATVNLPPIVFDIKSVRKVQ